MTVAFDPSSTEFVADPYPALSRLRAEDPVHWSERLGAWVLTRYDDVKLAITDPRFSAERVRSQMESRSDGGPAVPELRQLLGKWVVFTDPPSHTRLRGLMNKAFTTRAIEGLAPRIEAIVADLLADIDLRLAREGTFDAIRDLAFPLPVMVIADILGVPRTDHAQLKHWSDELATFVGTSLVMPDRHDRAERGISEMAAYFREHIVRHRAAPRGDLLSALIAAEDEGKLLDDEELVANCILLLFAGHETTANLIGNGILALMDEPAQWQALCARPDLIPDAVEEILRVDGPIAALGRVAAAEVGLGGRRIEAGDRVLCFLNAANRDRAVFDAPDRFDIRRNPNRHLTFGFGPHFCIGAPLARLEGKLAFEGISRRFEGLAGPDDQPEWIQSLVFRGIRALPMTVQEPARA